MNCREVKRKLSAYQDKELSASRMTEIADHLQICPDCSRSFQEMNQVWDLLTHVESIENAPFFWTRLSRHLNRETEKRSLRHEVLNPAQWLTRPIFATVILTVGLILGIYFGKSIYHQTTPTQSITAEQELDQYYSFNTFDDFPKESIADIYVTLISDNNQK